MLVQAFAGGAMAPDAGADVLFQRLAERKHAGLLYYGEGIPDYIDVYTACSCACYMSTGHLDRRLRRGKIVGLPK